MQRPETILLITSTIAPAPGTFALTVTDPAQRLAEYCAAFRFYLGLLDRGLVDSIVYADNSGHPLDALQAIAAGRGLSDRVEFLSFRSDTPPQNSRYYLEMRLIETAFARSERLDPGRDQTVWKVTGRYLVQNIARIIATAPAEADLYVNCRDHPVHTLDFFLVAFRAPRFAALLLGDLDRYRVREPAGEILLRQKIDAGAFAGLRVVPRFRVTPRVTAGRRGSDGARYAGARGTANYLLRSAVNALLPRLWI